MKQQEKPKNLTIFKHSPTRISLEYSENEGLNLFPKRQYPLNSRKTTFNNVKIHPEGHIIDTRYKWARTDTLLERIEKSELLPENKTHISRFIRDARLGKTIKKGQKKKVGVLRQAKYLQDLKKLDKYFQKPLEKVTEADMENFILDLEEGRVTKKNGQPYAEETQIAIKKVIIKFYKWLLGDGLTSPNIVNWIDTSYEVGDYTALKKEQIEGILTRQTSTTSANLVRNRAIVMFLFDSGVRADELLNVRIKHLTVEKDTYKVRIEYSKTKKRTIALPFSKEYLDLWLDIHPAREEPLAQLFPLRYTALCNVVKRAGVTIGATITPHSLRHSSATYWAARLTAYQLAYRFGWSMNSKQPARYIDQEGLDQEKVANAAEQESAHALRNQNEELHRRLVLMEEQFNRFLKGDTEEVKKIIEIVRKGDT